eukprot:Polyplicarium_translucidae@DN833_c0_g1_i3.p1
MKLSGRKDTDSPASGRGPLMPLGEFLALRLWQAGVRDVFGVPGDFVLGLLNYVLKSDLNYIGTCNELNAAYAADGYARVNGIGCLFTTYAVGELSALNGVAGSYAESVPVVKVTGAPSSTQFKTQPLLHHTLGDYSIPVDIYKKVTAAQALINNLHTATAEIDRVISVCLLQKQPVYIMICTDLVSRLVHVPEYEFVPPPPPSSDPGALEESLLETLMALQHSRKPIFVPGLDLQRAGLKAEFLRLLENSGMPCATMLLGKSIVDETHPQHIGLYSGSRSRETVRRRVEESDCVVVFGERLTDFNTGGFSAALDDRTTIHVARDHVRISYHIFQNVHIQDYVVQLANRIIKRDSSKLDIVPGTRGCTHRANIPFAPNAAAEMTMKRLFDRLASFFKENGIVIAETGASLFSAAEVMLPKGSIFLGQAFYGSIGYTVGATLGACAAAPQRPVYLIIGDGSFQVTCQDVSTMIRHGMKPVIFLLNNDGYTIERVIVDRTYNDIQRWKYSELLNVFGKAKSYCVRTEGELETALEGAANPEELTMIEITLDRWDCNDSLRAAGLAMAMENNLLETAELTRRRAESRTYSDLVDVHLKTIRKATLTPTADENAS